jgi:hypothetical protein
MVSSKRKNFSASMEGSQVTNDVVNNYRKLSWKRVGACDPDQGSNAVFDWVNKG